MHDDLIAGYTLAQKRRGLRDRTIAERQSFLRRFFRDVDPYAATTGDVELWLDACDLAIKSRATYLANLGPFFDWMVDVGKRDDNPVTKIRRPRVPRRVPRPAAPADLERALATADPKMRAWLLLAAYQGLRCCEIAGLRREAILDHETPPALIVEDAKGGHQRVLPLHPKVLDALRDYGLPPRGFVFPSVRTKGALTAHRLSGYINEHLDACGVGVTAHQFRHSFATTVYRLSHDLLMVQALLGHADPRSTAGYAAWDTRDAAKFVFLLDAGDENEAK
jgi:integrase